MFRKIVATVFVFGLFVLWGQAVYSASPAKTIGNRPNPSFAFLTTPPPPIVDEDFTDGLTGWLTPVNTGAATFDASTGEACATITTAAPNAWDMLLQRAQGLSIQQGHSYTVRFDAHADVPTQINAVWSLNASPWTTYFLQMGVQLSTTVQTYQYNFVMNYASDPASVFAFQLGGQIPAKICIDNVVLQDVTPPMTPTPAGTTTVTPTPQAGNPPIINDDFSGALDWYIVGAAVDKSSGAACVSFSDPKSNAWDIIFGNLQRFPIEQGHDYRVTYDAYADVNTQMTTLWSMDHQPYTTYLLEKTSVTTSTQSYQYDFTMTKPTDMSSTFAFQFGGRISATICIDNVVLVETSMIVPTPTMTPTATLPPTATPTPTITPTPIPTELACDIAVDEWYGGAKSAVSMTFDDSYESQYTHARPILDAHNMKATFYLVPPLTNGNGRYGTWAQFAELAAQGHEIGIQSMSDKDMTLLPEGDVNTSGTMRWELYQAKMETEINIPGYTVKTMAYSMAAHNELLRSVADDYFIAGRTVNGIANPAIISGMGWMTIGSYLPSFNQPRTQVSDDDDELNLATNWLQNSVVTPGTWGVFTWHDTVPHSELATNPTWQPITTEWLTSLTDWLQARVETNEIWVAPMGTVAEYMQVRDGLRCLMPQHTADSITLELINTTTYTQPVTMDIAVPADWVMADFVQGSYTKTITVTNGMINTEVMPSGTIQLRKSATVSLPSAVSMQTTQANSLWISLLAMLTVAVGLLALATWTIRRILH